MSAQKTISKPKASSSFAQNELDKAEKQFEKFNENVKEMTLDRMNSAPKEESESQTKLSSREMQNSKDIYLKPKKSLPPGVDPKTGKKEVFNEKFRSSYEFAKEYVQFVAEHKEILGEGINDIWTKPFPGIDAECWDVPTNKPIWGPRYLAEQIKRKSYHRFTMEDTKSSNLVNGGGMGQFYGAIAVDNTIQRLDAHPVSQQKSIFMGTGGF